MPASNGIPNHQAPRDRSEQVPPNKATGLPPPAASEWQPPLVDFYQLARGGNEVLIRLGESVYRLRRTRNDRLLLYK